jgi:predicted nucleotidyltransferase component of viral defense system
MSTYRTPAAFRVAVEARLKVVAKQTNRPINELRRQYLTQRFLARVYATPNPEWILLGGAALLARIPGARHSQDVDFIHPLDLNTATAELAALMEATHADPFAFDIKPAAPTDDEHLTLKVIARLGATTIDTFPVDITRRPASYVVDVVHPDPIIVVDDVDDLPPFLTVALSQQIADKLCAMYETHGAAALPSSRFRDLVDLMIILTASSDLDATAVITSVTTEQRRRTITIPTDLPAPSQQWTTGYQRMASRFLAENLHRLDAALEHLRAFAAPVLTGTASGTWQPTTNRWTQPTT